MINVLADQYLYDIASYLPEEVDLSLYDPADNLPDLCGINSLLVRTVNPINARTLPDIPDSLSFIGTASSGTDHVDKSYLESHNITFASAVGCNARSVAEYVTIGLLLWAEATGATLQNLSVAIIGVGHVGRQVQRQLEKLAITTINYDPPRADREPSFRSAPLEQVLNADILTFHTPLITDGKRPTYHWLDAERLSNSDFQLVINTARGGVVDEQALLEASQNQAVDHFMLDVWENEPHIRKQSAAKAFIKTPHIAGYSIQAKRKASKFAAEALLDHFGLERKSSLPRTEPKSVMKSVEQYHTLPDLLAELHPIRTYQRQLEQIIKKHWRDRGSRFNKLRASFPLRQEFGNIRLPESYFNRFPVLEKLGFRLIS